MQEDMNAVEHKIGKKENSRVTKNRAIATLKAILEVDDKNLASKKKLDLKDETIFQEIRESPKFNRKVEDAIQFLSSLDSDQKW